MAYQDILTSCNECGVCIDECLFLKKYNLTPLQAVLENEGRPSGTSSIGREHSTDLAFSCLLCGLCDSVCPSQLNPSKTFAELRGRTAQSSNAILSCKPYFTDGRYNLFSLYRSANSIDYSDLFKRKTKTILFPGCSLGTFFPRLTRALSDNLTQSEPDLGIMMDCCQRPLKDLGLEERYEKATAKLKAALDDMGVERIITACPSCLLVLGEQFKDRKVVSCYPLIRPNNDPSVLSSLKNRAIGGEAQSTQEDGMVRITVHDSCSDRETGVVGSQIRGLLSGTKHVKVVEMRHNRRNSLCCGAGGLVPATDTKLASEFTCQRIREAESSGAEIMITYCATCANTFSSVGTSSTVEVRHALELLLGVKEDYDAIVKNIDKLFVSGPKKELYRRLIESSPQQ